MLTFTPETRSYVYKIVIAVLPLLAALHVITPDYVDPILNVAEAVLGIGAASVAVSNVSHGPKDHRG
ncbi:hypothetical protein [Nocardia terpenica]|uniref:Holin n=1 Tax=Nocardia terpenica TaxID=455432 RepID=A0A164K5L6_9NOCA|nr:hypothetical protein [Nocardia terpenica]KZM71056.1 hypothetical protein AWN90_41805 [Nocardia terpenica]NQE89626.1 hypothetical protein [Nocardia terpenica]